MQLAPPSARISVVLASAIGVAGLSLAGVSVMYIAGMFGLSMELAGQIVHAVEVGGLALAVVMGLLSGGVAGVIIATARMAIAKWGKHAAIA